MANNHDPYLKLIPTLNQNLEHRVNEKNIVSLVTKNNHKIQNLFRKLSVNIPLETKIEMDEYSSFVFLQINGKQNVYKIGQKAQEKFPNNNEMLYERLIIFLDYLEEKKRIFYQ
ncbi:MAG: hypothetical protein ACK5HR_03140 [Mycoplasmatales bacterium]